MTENVFEVSFACENCGNKWTMQFPAFTKVDVDGIFFPRVRIVETNFPHTEIHRNMVFLDCPVCGLKTGINITSRKPIGGNITPV